MRRFDNSAERLAGNIHPARRLFLIKLFVIRQTNGFKFVKAQNNLLQIDRRYSPRLEIIFVRYTAYLTVTFRSGHLLDLLVDNYKHMPIISQW